VIWFGRPNHNVRAAAIRPPKAEHVAAAGHSALAGRSDETTRWICLIRSGTCPAQRITYRAVQLRRDTATPEPDPQHGECPKKERAASDAILVGANAIRRDDPRVLVRSEARRQIASAER
jgi:hypothetical protein